MAQSGHNLVRLSRGFQCRDCKTVRALKHVGYWTKISCRPRPPISLIIQQRKQDRAQILKAEWADLAASEQRNKKARQQHEQGQFLCNNSKEPAQTQFEQSNSCGDGLASNSNKRSKTSPAHPEAMAEFFADAAGGTLVSEVSDEFGDNGAEVSGSGVDISLCGVEVSVEEEQRALEPWQGNSKQDKEPDSNHANKACGNATTQDSKRTQSQQVNDEAASNLASKEGPDASKVCNESCSKRIKTQHRPGCEASSTNPLDDPEASGSIEEEEGETQLSNSNACVNPLDDPVGPSNLEEDDWDTLQDEDDENADPWSEPPEHQHAPERRPNPSHTRKRLVKKTKPGLTAYSHIKPKGDKSEQAKRKRKNQETLAANAKQRRMQVASATSTIASNIGIVIEKAERAGTSNGTEEMCDWDFARQIHSTHEIRSVHFTSEAFFCARCGCYNDGGQLRTLRKPCPGFVASERKHLHKLLSNGQVPRLGTKLGCGRDE